MQILQVAVNTDFHLNYNWAQRSGPLRGLLDGICIVPTVLLELVSAKPINAPHLELVDKY